jgi:chromosome segregation protein
VSRARLRQLRLVGFKSFAERTVVELGPGISAVVGPNGSGKSNLADGLRWALGEQGRALRSRRAEDLIFAGSANRRAVGMADVSLVIDNTDRLLSVDFGEVELSRRLFRSGENEYLLNRQRIRLRDLVELLDDANLADNAFLFIGQGMVDQALALRPEERRPLFEEAAGIRKHQRRRARAEGELEEASSNLERVRDLLAELRPQARRLAAQAEQQEARTAAGVDLAEALVEAARSRLGSAEVEAARHADALLAARRDADASLAALRDAEEAAATMTRALGDRADEEQRLREKLDEARSGLQTVELTRARLASEAEALTRERDRISDERTAATARADDARRRMAAMLPGEDHAAEDSLAQAEQRLAEAVREADELRRVGRADEERTAAGRAARERASADADRARWRASEAVRRLASQQESVDEARGRATAARAAAAEAETARAQAQSAEGAADSGSLGARSAARQAEADAASAGEEVSRLRAELETSTARHEALADRVGDGAHERALHAARELGGRGFADGLEVEPDLRSAVEAALGEILSGFVLHPDAARSLAEPPGVLILREDRDGRPRVGDRAASRLEERILAAGGGWLADALRRDPDRQAGRLLARCAWVPDLRAALALRELLPAGWRLVTRSGVVVDDVGVIRPAPGSSALERRAAREDLARRIERTRAALDAALARATALGATASEAEARVARSNEALEVARRERRLAEGAERSSASAAENAARELAWQEATLERARVEAEIATAESEARARDLTALDGSMPDQVADPTSRSALAALDARVGALRDERERVAAVAVRARAEREQALEEQRRAEVGLGLAEARTAELDASEAGLAAREADVAAEHERSVAALAAAQAVLRTEREAFEASVAASRAERADLLAAEVAAGTAREQLRLAEQRSRAIEVAGMEARLQADAAREGLLVELAAIGPDGLTALLGHSERPAPTTEPSADELPELLEQALDEALEGWRLAAAAVTSCDELSPEALAATSGAPFGEAPTRARIAALRRRFNDVGASNPFAVQELAEVKGRLESLEAQREDLERAIRDTRELMARLDTLMSDQFRETFRALEGAFERRFHQLFGGGEAELSLTDPSDLTTTGVEITARPPGKRRQPLAMLSGGERALTAVALLMAMLEVRPVPFCVLDEVDAALDEANIGRFSAALRSLAEEIQFVVITHNRGTIEAADALYGVTVGDDAVSRVVSLRLADLPADDPALSSVGA